MSKFKVGDRVRVKNDRYDYIGDIVKIEERF